MASRTTTTRRLPWRCCGRSSKGWARLSRTKSGKPGPVLTTCSPQRCRARLSWLRRDMPALDIGGTRVEFLEQGSGEPVLLLHSSGSSSAQWRSLIETLRQRYRVLAPDFYGCGRTGAWPKDSFALADEAEIACALLRRAGGRAHLIGHSYGGTVALHVARRFGHAVRS